MERTCKIALWATTALLAAGGVSHASAPPKFDYKDVPFYLEKEVGARDALNECFESTGCMAVCEVAATAFEAPGACTSAKSTYQKIKPLVTKKDKGGAEDASYTVEAPPGYVACDAYLDDKPDTLTEIGKGAFLLQSDLAGSSKDAWQFAVATRRVHDGGSRIKAYLVLHNVRSDQFAAAVKAGKCKPAGSIVINRAHHDKCLANHPNCDGSVKKETPPPTANEEKLYRSKDH